MGQVSLVLGIFPSDQTIQIVAVRTKSPKFGFVEQTLDSASQANLVRVAHGTYWPAHLAMPATAEKDQGSPCGTGSQDSPLLPTRLRLQIVTHRAQIAFYFSE